MCLKSKTIGAIAWSEEFTWLLTWSFPLPGTAGKEQGGISALPKNLFEGLGAPAAAGVPVLRGVEAFVLHPASAQATFNFPMGSTSVSGAPTHFSSQNIYCRTYR